MGFTDGDAVFGIDCYLFRLFGRFSGMLQVPYELFGAAWAEIIDEAIGAFGATGYAGFAPKQHPIDD